MARMTLRILLLSLLGTLVAVPSALAVSYPNAEVSGNRVPYVASIMYVDEPGNWSETQSSICTGTFIARGFVITAAHCLEGVEPENLYVGTGPSTDGLGYCAVLSYEDHPRYRKGRISVNDIALMRVTAGCEPRRFPKLPRRNARVPVALTLYGWGLNQNRELPDELGVLRAFNYSEFGRDFFGRNFNPATQIAAGRFFPREDIFAGACSGDSGGPLVAGRGARPTLVGVVSWGTFFGNSCEPAAPTVFTKMSYYTGWVKSAKRRISRLIKNRTYGYSRPAGDAVANDGIDYVYAGLATSSEVSYFEWVWTPVGASAGGYGVSFSIDTNFDGTPELTGDATRIANAEGATLCTPVSDQTDPLSNGAQVRSIGFPTSCIRQFREFADVTMTLNAGGSAESTVVEGVAFPPVR